VFVGWGVLWGHGGPHDVVGKKLLLYLGQLTTCMNVVGKNNFNLGQLTTGVHVNFPYQAYPSLAPTREASSATKSPVPAPAQVTRSSIQDVSMLLANTSGCKAAMAKHFNSGSILSVSEVSDA